MIIHYTGQWIGKYIVTPIKDNKYWKLQVSAQSPMNGTQVSITNFGKTWSASYNGKPLIIEDVYSQSFVKGKITING